MYQARRTALKQEQKQRFLDRFSQCYLREDAAAKAGITDAEAIAYLKRTGTRAALDERISARLAGKILTRIRQEYEAMAFGDDESIRPADRIRALEQLRHLASADNTQGDAPSLIIRCEYV
jgi:hypothetical protein